MRRAFRALLPIVPLAGATLAFNLGGVAAEERKGWTASIFGNYENRIREMSAPEKVFGYFASVKKGDESFMTPNDFFRAITPYNPYSHTELPEELPAAFARVMKVADPNGDGLISFPEYLFFTSLLSIPPTYFEVAFQLMDRDGNDKVDSDEFKKVMKVIQSHNPILRAARQVKRSVLDESVLLPGWFGEKGEKQLSFQQFNSFLQDLHNSVREVYFESLDRDHDGFISSREFAISLVNFATVRALPKFVSKIERMPDDDDDKVRMSLKEFLEWKHVMEHLDEIDLAISLFIAGVGNEFSTNDLKRAAKTVTGVTLKDEHLAVALQLFDDDGNGTLSRAEFFDTLHKNQSFGIAKPRDFGLQRFVVCCKECISNNKQAKKD